MPQHEIGIHPFNFDLLNPASRFRGYNLVKHLKALDLEVELMDWNGLNHCKTAIIGCYNSQQLFSVYRKILYLRQKGTYVIFDMADDIIKAQKSDYLKKEVQQQLCDLLSIVNVVVTSSMALKNNLQKITKTPVFQIPDLVDEPSISSEKAKLKVNHLVWFGYKNNITNLIPLVEVLKKAHEDIPNGLLLNIVGSDERTVPYKGILSNKKIIKKYFDFPVKFHDWSIKVSEEISKTSSICIIPSSPSLPKSSNKLIQAIGNGCLPIVANSIDYQHILGDAAPELLCSSDEDWYKVLKRALSDDTWRDNISDKLSKLHKDKYSNTIVANQWHKIISAKHNNSPINSSKPSKQEDDRFSNVSHETILIKELVKRFFKTCKSRDINNIALYGNGKHTDWLLSIIQGPDFPSISYILEDAPTVQPRGNIPVIHPSELSADTVDAIALSTDAYQDQMLQKLSHYKLNQIEALDIYEGLPRISFNK